MARYAHIMPIDTPDAAFDPKIKELHEKERKERGKRGRPTTPAREVWSSITVLPDGSAEIVVSDDPNPLLDM